MLLLFVLVINRPICCHIFAQYELSDQVIQDVLKLTLVDSTKDINEWVKYIKSARDMKKVPLADEALDVAIFSLSLMGKNWH
jgi:hypothetical protein